MPTRTRDKTLFPTAEISTNPFISYAGSQQQQLRRRPSSVPASSTSQNFFYPLRGSFSTDTTSASTTTTTLGTPAVSELSTPSTVSTTKVTTTTTITTTTSTTYHAPVQTLSTSKSVPEYSSPLSDSDEQPRFSQPYTLQGRSRPEEEDVEAGGGGLNDPYHWRPLKGTPSRSVPSTDSATRFYPVSSSISVTPRSDSGPGNQDGNAPPSYPSPLPGVTDKIPIEEFMVVVEEESYPTDGQDVDEKAVTRNNEPAAAADRFPYSFSNNFYSTSSQDTVEQVEEEYEYDIDNGQQEYALEEKEAPSAPAAPTPGPVYYKPYVPKPTKEEMQMEEELAKDTMIRNTETSSNAYSQPPASPSSGGLEYYGDEARADVNNGENDIGVGFAAETQFKIPDFFRNFLSAPPPWIKAKW